MGLICPLTCICFHFYMLLFWKLTNIKLHRIPACVIVIYWCFRKNVPPQISRSSESQFAITNILSGLIRNYVQYATWQRLFTHCSLCIGMDGWWGIRKLRSVPCLTHRSHITANIAKANCAVSRAFGLVCCLFLQGPIALLFQPIKIQGCSKCPVSSGLWSARMTMLVRKRRGCQGDRNWRVHWLAWQL